MSTPAITPPRAAGRASFSGLLGVIILLLGTLAGTIALTAYLLRTAVTPAVPVARPVEPAPFRVLYLRDGQVWSTGSGAHQQQITSLPPGLGARLRQASLSPDGEHALLVTDVGATDHVWLLSTPRGAPLALADQPPGKSGPVRHYLASAWTGPHKIAVLRASGDRAWLVEYTFGTAGVHATWDPVQGSPGLPASLSPDAAQVALVLAQRGDSSFAQQVIVRLQRIDGTRPSIAYRYLGTAQPGTVLWSPDGGTLAIPVPGLGLAIQKSSGRPVRLVADGTLPAAFSNRDARFAYVSGRPGSWQLHVLALHGEIDSTIGPVLASAPRWLYWTPDARALLYATPTGVWQVEVGSSTSTLLAANAQGTALGVARTGSSFGR